jgi:chaperonin cofactor prefoldin
MATPQLQQQMFELSSQLSETVNNLKIAEGNLIALETEKRRHELTLNEVSGHSDDLSKLYKPIGRMFMHFTNEEIQRDIARSLERVDGEMAEYKVITS